MNTRYKMNKFICEVSKPWWRWSYRCVIKIYPICTGVINELCQLYISYFKSNSLYLFVYIGSKDNTSSLRKSWFYYVFQRLWQENMQFYHILSIMVQNSLDQGLTISSVLSLNIIILCNIKLEFFTKSDRKHKSNNRKNVIV